MQLEPQRRQGAKETQSKSIWLSHWLAAGLPRRGSCMLGAPAAHHVQPFVFTRVGWGILAFIAWVLFTPR